MTRAALVIHLPLPGMNSTLKIEEKGMNKSMVKKRRKGIHFASAVECLKIDILQFYYLLMNYQTLFTKMFYH